MELKDYRVAESVTIATLPHGGKTLLIDGEPLPYHLAADGPTIEEVIEGVMYIVNVPIIVFADAIDGEIQ